MRESWKTASCRMIMTLIALAPCVAAAQSNSTFGSNPFEDFAGGGVRGLEQAFQVDLYALGAFDGRRSVDRYERGEAERAQPWKFYGRLGPMHFQNQLDSVSQGFQFSFRRQGPSLTGRAYVGFYRTFD